MNNEVKSDLDKCCAFTGHRPHKLPWKDNENDPRCIALKKMLTKQIAAMTEAGITDFFSGMSEGTDHYCAQIVLALREKNPVLNLHCNPTPRRAGGQME